MTKDFRHLSAFVRMISRRLLAYCQMKEEKTPSILLNHLRATNRRNKPWLAKQIIPSLLFQCDKTNTVLSQRLHKRPNHRTLPCPTKRHTYQKETLTHPIFGDDRFGDICFERYHKNIIMIQMEKSLQWADVYQITRVKTERIRLPSSPSKSFLFILSDCSGLGIPSDHIDSLAARFLVTFPSLSRLPRKEHLCRDTCSLHVVRSGSLHVPDPAWLMSFSSVWGYGTCLSFEMGYFITE